MSKDWVNFEGINAAALAASPELLKKWLPRGRVVGREFQVGNLRGDPGDSLKVNLNSGKWADFSTDEAGGDLVALYAAIHRLDQATAARMLASDLGVANDTAGRHGPNAHRPDQWRSILPPATPPPDVLQHPSLGRADTTWTYCDATGTLLLIVCRWNRIGRSKAILPLSYGVLNGIEGWHFKHPAAPRPLYGLDRRCGVLEVPPRNHGETILYQLGIAHFQGRLNR